MNSGGAVMGSMSFSGPTVTRKAADVPDQFPAGLRVLVVDDDPTCLSILEKMLRFCRYEVTKTNRAEIALTLLLENRNKFDIVISDVHMPDMDGFTLLERVGLEMDLPVIMMSADDSKSVVMKGVTHGACDYLIKPVRIEALKNIWQHVVRKKKNEWKDIEQSSSLDEGNRQQKQDNTVSSSGNEGSLKGSKRKYEDDNNDDDNDDTTNLKKPRVVWSVELHQQFVAAVNQLGIDKAVPKKILELMNVPGLTRENVASHLQKYRLYLRRLSGNSSFMAHDSGFGGFDFQTLAAYTQMTPAVKLGISVPFVDQRNLLSNVNTQMDLLHGVPTTTVEPNQLRVGLNLTRGNASSSHQNSSLLIQMTPQQSVNQVLNESLGGQVSRVQSSTGESNSGVLLSGNGIGYNPVSQGAPPLVDFSVSSFSNSPSTIGVTSVTTPKTFKATNRYTLNYDAFGELQQHKSRDWQLQNPGMTFRGSFSQHGTSAGQTNVNVLAPLAMANRSFIPNLKNRQDGGDVFGRKAVFSGGLELDGNQHLVINNRNLKGVKEEEVSDVVRCSRNNNVFPEASSFGEEDLMSALLKQVTNEF